MYMGDGGCLPSSRPFARLPPLIYTHTMLRSKTENFKNVLVRVPEFDRGRAAPRNVMCFGLSINQSVLYHLGKTKVHSMDVISLHFLKLTVSTFMMCPLLRC